jgi:hypothetical protein
MASWASYFYAYVGFNRNSMDDEDEEVRKWWHAQADLMFGPQRS